MENKLANLADEASIEYVPTLEPSLDAEHNEYEKLRAEHERLLSERKKLQAEYEERNAEYEKLRKRYDSLSENFEKLRKMLFGRSSEKTRFIEDADQLSFLSRVVNEAEAFAAQADKDEVREIRVPGHKRKRKRSRAELLAQLPVVETLHRIGEENRVCGACEGKIRYLGKEHVRDELEIVPARMYVNRIFRENYVCDACHADENQIRVAKAATPEPVVKNSLASPSAVAGVVYQKYVNAIPLARQERDWSYQGVNVGRETLGNWVLKASKEHLQPLYDLMKDELLKAKIVAADETEVQVLKEKDRLPQTKSRMWVYRTVGRETSKPVVLFEYQPGRHGAYARDFLKGWNGILMTDAYTGYDQVAGVTRAYCFAHARRYWFKALPKNPEGSKAKIGLDFCDKLFELERKWVDLRHEERRKMRNAEARPVLDEYFAWVESLDCLAGSNLGKAAEYSINHKDGLRCYLTDGEIELSTNIIERDIRSFVIGRNNWVAIDTVAGAKASAVCYSIVITARENGLNPFEYLKHLFEELPKRRKDKDSPILKDCLPWSETLPDKCRIGKPPANACQEQLPLK